MSGMFSTDKQYLSFNLSAIEAAGLDTDWLTPRVERSITRGLMFAVLISVLVHSFFLPWIFSFYQTSAPADISKSRSIHLAIKSLARPVAAESPVTVFPHPDIIAAPPTPQLQPHDTAVSPEALPSTPVPEPIVPKSIEPAVIDSKPINSKSIDLKPTDPEPLNLEPINPEPISQELISPRSIDPTQLKDLIQQARIGYDADVSLNTTDQSMGKPQGSRRFNNVFHPGLREELQHNAMHRSQEKYEAGGESIDVYRSTFVEIDEGHCLMAVTGGASDVTDWYHTKCAGYKDEGEQIMQRVNESLRKTR